MISDRYLSKIIWQYKLAPKTTNLSETDKVKEIEVFDIVLKTGVLDTNILRCIDKAIAHPIIFHLVYDGKTKVIATYKRPNEADANKWVISEAYFETDWLSAETERKKLPVVLNLSTLYEYILRELIPLQAREDESLESQIDRLGQVITKAKEVKKLEARMDKEKQFNRKVEMNAELRSLNNEIDQLKHGKEV